MLLYGSALLLHNKPQKHWQMMLCCSDGGILSL